MHPFFKHLFTPLWILLFFLCACKKDEPLSSGIDIFYKSMTSLKLEVAYEEGAEPYAISTSGDNVWEYAELNIESLFVQRPLALDVIVPNGLNEMTAIPDQNKTGFTVDNILGLANHYRKSTGNETDGNIFILFLNGYYRQDDTLRQTVMGLHVTGTTVVAVFKPLIASSHVTRVVREFVEQGVVIHEAGHALGMVNNGLPLASPHHDSAHGAHCTNSECVMYWQNERTANITGFVQNYFGGSKRMIFGDECVADVVNYQP
ncbi:MAG TPA: hypothetical protein VNJ07_07055 [Chitinophagales bacterium]|nr:hypothetical protein [Chitinophagales bacterium]